MPHRWNGKLVPGDPRHGTRWATDSERAWALALLTSLETSHNRIELVPAPHPSFHGQKIRVQTQANVSWYRSFVERGRVKRSRVARALKRVAEVGVVRRNGYELRLLARLSPGTVRDTVTYLALGLDG